MSYLILPQELVQELESEREAKRQAQIASMNVALGNSVKTKVHYLPESDTAVYERVQDVEGVLEANQTIRNSGFDGYSKDRSMRQIMNIPLVVVEEIKNKHGVDFYRKDDNNAFRKIIKSEYPHLITVDKI